MLMLLLMLLATLLAMLLAMLLATLLATLLTLLAMPPMALLMLLMLPAMTLLTLLPRSERCAVPLGRPENDRAKLRLRAVVLFCARIIGRLLRLAVVTTYGAIPVDRKKAMARSMESARGVDGIPSSVRALLPSKYAPRCRYCMLLSVARGSS